MKLSSDDPKLTAYALGELDEKERAEIEAALNEQSRREVEEIRATAALLSKELANEPCPALADTQREKIESAVAPSENKIIRLERPKRFSLRAVAAIAASLVCIGIVARILLPALDRARKSVTIITTD